jgi:hypothetical protein
VPETLSADVLFSNMQKEKTHFAIVADEYGGFAGIVTMDDLLGEIVGEIEDEEYDEEIEEEIEDIISVSENEWDIDGLTPLEELGELTGAELPLDEFDTLSGLVLHCTESIPEDGATFAYEIDSSRGNVFENNCYYNALTPLVDTDAMNTVPGFSGTDYSDINSFKLSSDSPLIGAGTKIDGVEKDFFGDMIQSNNIGCYGGTGTDAEYEGEGILELIIRTIKNFFQTIWHEIYVIFD